MKKLVWLIVAVAIAIWSGLAWAAHSLIGWGGTVANNNADIVTQNPEAVEWLSWLALFGSDVGSWLVIGVWGFGVLLALLIGFAGTRLFPRLGTLSQKANSQQ
jgi:hypothetical protein